MLATCPGCGSLHDPTASCCPVCLRPRSRAEIFRGIHQTHKRPSRLRWTLILGIPVLAAAAAYLAYEKGYLKPPQTALEPQPVALSSAPVAAAAAVSTETAVSTAAIAAAEEPPARPSPAEMPERYRRNDPASWAVKGRAYDLFSLRPVPKVRLTLTSMTTGDEFRAVSNARGDYSVKVPRLREGGYMVKVRHKDYQDNYLDEMDPPYSAQGLERRQEAAELMRQTEVLHVPILLPENESQLDYDVVLLPRPRRF